MNGLATSRFADEVKAILHTLYAGIQICEAHDAEK